MPLLHRRDDIKRRVVVTATGPFQAAHVIDCLERQRDDGTWTYGVLFDTRGMTGHATIDDVRLVMKRLATPMRSRGHAVLWQCCGPTRTCTPSRACVPRSAAHSERLKCFATVTEADTWLAAQGPVNSLHLAKRQI